MIRERAGRPALRPPADSFWKKREKLAGLCCRGRQARTDCRKGAFVHPGLRLRRPLEPDPALAAYGSCLVAADRGSPCLR